MGKFVLLFAIVGLCFCGYYYWQVNLDGELPSWGYIYNATPEEKQLADSVAELTNVWRQERVLPQLKTEEGLCSHADRYVRDVAKTNGSRDAFPRMVAENTIVIQASYDKIAETAGYARTAQDLVQTWSENTADRNVLQDETLTHRCVRCSGQYCAQIYIRQTATK